MNGTFLKLLTSLSVLVSLPCLFSPHNLAATEIIWFNGVLNRAGESQERANTLDRDRLDPSGSRVSLAFRVDGPWEVTPATGRISATPRGVFQVESPDPGMTPFSWRGETGITSAMKRTDFEDSLMLESGVLIGAGLELRFAPGVSGNPSREVRILELTGRLRENAQIAARRVEGAAGYAARSASAYAEHQYLRRVVVSLQTEQRKYEIELGAGLIARAQYVAAQDALYRAIAQAEDQLFEATSFGLDARDVTIEGGGPSHFDAADLFQIALLLEPLLATADPGRYPAEAARAPWDLRMLENSAGRVLAAPRFSLDTELRLLPENAGGVRAEVSGRIGVLVPLGGGSGHREREDGLRRYRDTAVTSALTRAQTRQQEAIAMSGMSKTRVANLERRVAQREERWASWQGMAEDGTATRLDSSAADASLWEARSELSRAQAGYFLFLVSALVELGTGVSEMLSVVQGSQ